MSSTISSYLRLAFISLVAVTLAVGTMVRAEHPPTTQLLPKNTVAYLSVPDTRQLAERMKKTSLGRMMQDPQMAPLVKDLYGSAATALSRMEEEVGLTLDDVLTMPQGELTLAVIAPEEGPVAVVAFFDAGDRMPQLQKLLDRAQEEIENRDTEKSEETVDGTTITIYQDPDRENRRMAYFQKEGSLVLSTQVEVIKDVLANWKGREKGDTLGANQQFTAIMSRCRGSSKDERPQFMWFIDPVKLAETALSNNAQAQIALAVFPVLGLDGLKGIGGSVTMATEQYDSVTHMHLLLDNPRAGVVELIALKAGDTTPENWVPADVSNYTTVNWDVTKSYDKAASLVDSFFGEGTVRSRVQRAIEDTGLDFEEDVLTALEGRFTYTSWIEPPATPQSAASLMGIKLKDAEKFDKTLDKLVENYSDFVTEKLIATHKCYLVTPPQLDDAQRERRRQPCFCRFGDYLLVADRPSFLERAILTAGGANERLAGSVEYKLIASKIRRQPGGGTAGMVSFDRPEEGLRWLYGMATSDQTQQRLSEQAEENEFFQSLKGALDKNPLPAFAVLKQYLAPGGAMLTDDDSGIHYMNFTLRREGE